MTEPDAPEEATLKEKMLFYTTAFFVLLGTFSLFAFLFLVPFVIDPAFTTIFMEFNPTAAMCFTVDTESRKGASNCSWTSCREGCTKEIYACTQIRVNYKRVTGNSDDIVITDVEEETDDSILSYTNGEEPVIRSERAIREYDYKDYDSPFSADENRIIAADDGNTLEDTDLTLMEGLSTSNDSEWYFRGAKLFPNVKGCGYPPMVNCVEFFSAYQDIGTNFSCYYSEIDPGIVISELDMWQVYMNLVYAMAIPIPSFICSVIYLTIAYFKIYNEDEEKAPLEKNAEEMDVQGGDTGETPISTGTPVPPTSGAITPGSEAFREDLASFGHQLKVQMADEMSRESLDEAPITTGVVASLPG